jgi:ribosomal protein L7Ae-like RNA K-turn-binding protein
MPFASCFLNEGEVIMDRQIVSLISICKKAGFLQTGAFTCEKVVRAGKASLVIVCTDASENTRKKFSQKAFYYGVPYKEMLTMEELSRAIGAEQRSVAVITDSNLSERILTLTGVDSDT